MNTINDCQKVTTHCNNYDHKSFIAETINKIQLQLKELEDYYNYLTIKEELELENECC